jgi:hypothetical protein
VASDHEDRADRRQRVGDGVEHGHEVGADDEELCRRVVDDELDLGWGESPVDVDADGVRQGGAEEDLEVLDPVLVERDAVWEPTPAAAGPAAAAGPLGPAPPDMWRSPMTSAGRSAAWWRRMSATLEMAIAPDRSCDAVSRPGR